MSSINPELIGLVSYISLELVSARFSYSAPSPSLKHSLVKPIDDYAITDPTDDLGLVGIEKQQLEGRVNEFDRSLGNYKG